MRKFTGISAISVAALSLSSGAVVAQEADQSANEASPAAAIDPDLGDVIVVTAQRREERLEKVPISVTAITPSRIADLNIRSLESIETVTPGLVFKTGAGFPQMYIRGVGSTIPTPGLESPVAVYIDGAYSAQRGGVRSALTELLDVGSVQILKGAQGTLYGKNATGGAILVETADPNYELSLAGTAEAGRFDEYMFEAIANVPLSDTLAVRFAGRYRNEGGFIRNITTGRRALDDESVTLRGKILWEPTAEFTATLTAGYTTHTSDVGIVSQILVGPELCAGCAFGGNFTSEPYEVASDLDVPFSEVTDDNYTLNLELDYAIGAINLKSVTAYQDAKGLNALDADGTSLNLLAIRGPYNSETFVQELQASSDLDGPINFLAGFQYVHDDATIGQIRFGLAAGVPYGDQTSSTIEQTVVSETIAAFVEAYFNPLDRITITVGGRYTESDRTLDSVISPTAVAVFNPGGPTTFVDTQSDNKFTPRFVVAYDADAVNLYASFTRGYRSGGFNTPTVAPAAIEIFPETLDNYEVGAKFVSDDNRLRISLAAFHYDYKDLLVNRVNDTGTANFTENAANASANGFEAQLDYRALDWFDISAGFAYLDAEYDEYLNAPVPIIIRDAMGNPLGIGTAPTDLSGTPLTRSPEWTAFLSANATVPISENWIARLNGVVNYTSSFVFEPGGGGELGNDVQGETAMINLSGGIGPASEDFEIGFYVDNLTNVRRFSWRTTSQLGAVGYPLSPRTYGVRVKWMFR